MKLFTFLSILTVSASICCSAQSGLQCFEYSEVAMGVRARIVLYAPDELTAKNTARAAFLRIANLEDIMSDYRPTSEIMRLCDRAGGPPVEVSKELMFILKRSRDLSERSNGAFDVTIGPLARLWKKTRESGALPAKSELIAARRLVGWRKVIIDEEAQTVRLTTRGMSLDLGGIAKGYACDEAILILKENGIGSALVEMGGDIVVGDSPPGADGWKIEIADSQLKRDIFLANAAISSSGDTEQFMEIDGRHYSHIVNPKTGIGLTNRIAVTVIAPDGITADGLSTAISVLGEDKGSALARKFPEVTAFIRRAVD